MSFDSKSFQNLYKRANQAVNRASRSDISKTFSLESKITSSGPISESKNPRSFKQITNSVLKKVEKLFALRT